MESQGSRIAGRNHVSRQEEEAEAQKETEPSLLGVIISNLCKGWFSLNGNCKSNWISSMWETLKERHFQNYFVKQINLCKIQRSSPLLVCFCKFGFYYAWFPWEPELFRKKDFSLINY